MRARCEPDYGGICARSCCCVGNYALCLRLCSLPPMGLIHRWTWGFIVASETDRQTSLRLFVFTALLHSQHLFDICLCFRSEIEFLVWTDAVNSMRHHPAQLTTVQSGAGRQKHHTPLKCFTLPYSKLAGTATATVAA